MTNKHLSTQFNSELNALSAQISIMGALVEKQVVTAVEALKDLDLERVAHIFQEEQTVNQMEIAIDQDLTTIIARRQPIARDLRLLIAISKATTDLERVGDEAINIARMTKKIAETERPKYLIFPDLSGIVEMVTQSLRQALDALARLDVTAAINIMRADEQIDVEFDLFTSKLITYMSNDPQTISACLNFLSVAKALERIGDHATNIAEFIIYIVKGEDVRHLSMAQLDDLHW